MRPNTDATISVTGTATGDNLEKIAFGIDQNSLAHLQSVLSNLYANRELAILRELSTNAFDAHTEAGVTLPVEVTLPTALNPVFVVKDSGVGMDIDDLNRIYTKYGASTKRETDDQTGTLGLGSKAPLALVDTFTVTTTKGGQTTVAIVSKDGEGIGQMTIVENYQSDAASGTEISIPVPASSIRSFRAAADSLFPFFPEGTVLVDTVPNTAMKNTVRLSENVVFVPERMTNAEGHYRSASDYVVMGNVPYPVQSFEDMNTQENRYLADVPGHLVVYVPMGSVNFTPAREALNYTPRTRKVLTDIADSLESLVFKAAKKALAAAETRADAAILSDQWVEVLSSLYYRSYSTGQSIRKWRGQPIPDTFTTDGAPLWNGINEKRTYLSNSRYVNRRDIPHTLFVTGFTSNGSTSGSGTGVTATVRQKTRAWIAENVDANIDMVLFCDTFTTDGWVAESDTHFVTYAEIQKVKLSRAKGKVAVDPVYQKWTGRYDDFADVKGSELAQLIADGGTVVMFSPSLAGNASSRDRYSNAHSWFSNFAAEHVSDTVVFVRTADTRKAKMLRLLPQAVELADFVKEQAEKFVAENPNPLPEPNSKVRDIGDYAEYLNGLTEVLDDDILVESIRYAALKNQTDFRTWSQTTSMWRMWASNAGVTVDGFASLDLPPLDLEERYPILSLMNDWQLRRLYASDPAGKALVTALNDHLRTVVNADVVQ